MYACTLCETSLDPVSSNWDEHRAGVCAMHRDEVIAHVRALGANSAQAEAAAAYALSKLAVNLESKSKPAKLAEQIRDLATIAYYSELIAEDPDGPTRAQLYLFLYPRFEALLASWGLQDATIRDILQDAFVTLLECDNRAFDDPIKVMPLLYTIVKNRRIDRFRKDNRLSGLLNWARRFLSKNIENDHPHYEENTKDDVHEAIAKLPHNQRVTIENRYFLGLTHAQNAIALGITEVNSRRLLSHAQQKLYKLLKPQE
jgi:RNA polymerase sigma factor (sigma-70 family)